MRAVGANGRRDRGPAPLTVKFAKEQTRLYCPTVPSAGAAGSPGGGGGAPGSSGGGGPSITPPRPGTPAHPRFASSSAAVCRGGASRRWRHRLASCRAQLECEACRGKCSARRTCAMRRGARTRPWPRRRGRPRLGLEQPPEGGEGSSAAGGHQPCEERWCGVESYGERTLNAHCETHIVKRTTEEDWIILVYMNALLHIVYTEMRDDGDVSS